jgi:hypothetical protein
VYRQTSWADLQQAFENRGKRSLQTFFDQWVHRKGAPRFALDAVSADRTGNGWRITGKIAQDQPVYEFPLALVLETAKQAITQTVTVSGPVTPFELTSAHRPLKLVADPADDVFRRLAPSEIPPAVNALKGSPSVITVLAEQSDPDLNKAARTLALSLGLKRNKFIAENELNRQQLFENDILLIGRPQRIDLLKNMPAGVEVRPKSFSLGGSLYDRPSDAFFGVFEHPFAPDRVTALYLPLSAKDADIVAAKITHYGKYGYLVFQDGRNQAKGFWPVQISPLVYRWPGSNE